jgi:glycosyltransferase involved in cell wall biosynthesis
MSKITVAVPTIDRPEMLGRAVRSALAQTHRDVEVVISDNASSTDMSSVAQEFADDRVRFQRHEARLPMAENWNSCLDLAEGKYFLLLSDDDVLRPDALTSLVAGFEEDELGGKLQIGFCYGRAVVVDAQERTLWTTARGPRDESAVAFYRGVLRNRRSIYPCGTLFRTEDLRAVGGYDGDRFAAAADFGAAIRAALERGRVRYVDRVVCHYTEHQANLTSLVDVANWSDTLREISAMVDSIAELPVAQQAAMQRDMNEFIAYFVMDVVGKRALFSGSGTLQAWILADRARRTVVHSPTIRARSRAMAKLFYLRAMGLANSIRERS